ncbi:hypothetical protein OS493_030152 [Desmophyllum pertusum]|uniref:Uncharacterized protein n=1 Tax=Desmophyllum pertusum TaxID=174260 RepID=A0A9W9YWH1_9CNID|nr:hypothetical protein OS493_030152 [Desmophyllum pertusum]
MSLVIDIEKFPNLSSIFAEIEQQDKQRKTTAFTTMEPQVHKTERKPGSVPNRRRASVPIANKPSVAQSRVRIQSTPCPTIDLAELEGETRLTDAAKQLSNEELGLLYEDILKPLDVYSMLHGRQKASDELKR